MPRAALPIPHSRLPIPLRVHVGYAVPRAGLPAPASFRRWVEAALRGAKRRKGTELAIRIVDTDEGRALNRDYRGKDYATNVLSFPAELPPGVKLPLIGDLAICAPVVLREATEQGKSPRDHWAHLTVHGVLHLLGYDHIEEAEAEAMEALETRVLASLGIGDPYA
ncbi:rRNA maturation RNase YbeY [Rhodanobacter thiooxydans]|uniref:rRNA maturation RNase YbeY n=1 Tax=Rhodanobacter thiooxydans TaxID=416169 RepID=UPI000586727E|nr:rRNA maturation RNase YbeY [Rhodanobacter thiooxydans]MCW0201490.1 rRNA maturation RNase YbeY [Rhodanobacter thiooxydans]